jgi:hypothetical protein
VLGAAAPPPAQGPSEPAAVPQPEQWGIVTSLPGDNCGAKAPTVNGVDLNIMLAPNKALSLILGNPAWKIEARTYEVVMKLDDLDPFTFSMHGQGPALIGEIPPGFRAEFLTAGKIGFHVGGVDYAVQVRNLTGVVARLETCVEARQASDKQK